ncbi:MAG: UDP-N-acetylmuramoyl-L-alanyl-D-glutamate--2,6-diaminopimelate ligase, partial [Oscillospiraceae bacterium]
KKYIAIVDRRDAIRYAIATANQGDTIILAGKGHEQYQILGDKKLYFDERRLVRGILKSLG